MLKLEIKFNDAQMRAEHKYAPESIYAALDKSFMPRDYGTFGRLITTLKDKEWFMAYLVKWLWYNSDDGENETDFIVEDVLYHYAHRESAA